MAVVNWRDVILGWSIGGIPVYIGSCLMDYYVYRRDDPSSLDFMILGVIAAPLILRGMGSLCQSLRAHVVE